MKWLSKIYVLASKSPRRIELMKKLNLDFSIHPSEADEVFPDELEIGKIPEYLARQKAIDVQSILNTNNVIVAADTIVAFNNKVIGKPKDLDEAKQTVINLSGNIHKVISGVCVIYNNEIYSFSATTEVTMIALTEGEIEYYINHYEVLDKAGSYGIQDWIGLVGIEKINGCYHNVMGLPVSKLVDFLKEILE